jgi:ubiquinone/menaquinone biosynthesis C-methylase UbiE
LPSPIDPQSFSVKRSQVEFHNFASLGDTSRVIAHYLDENTRRASIIQTHREFIGPMTPFLEIGANAGHTSYMLANQFGGEGFALDLSADALRHGAVLMDRWQLSRAPVRVAGDAVNLPFRDGSIQFVMACQMLSQFMDMESVFREVKRVLAPGGVFLFTEEPLRRLLSLRLYRAPYQDRMEPWERKLFDWGLLGYLARDVIGAEQEESFGIRQNHKMYLGDWRRLVARHFAEYRFQPFAPERGWGEWTVKRAAGNEWRAARLLGGTLAAVCRKAGAQPPGGISDTPPADVAQALVPAVSRLISTPLGARDTVSEASVGGSAGAAGGANWASACATPRHWPGSLDRFEALLRCPDCHGDLARDATDTLVCACGYRAANEGGVYNLLPAALRAELYPADRADIIDFSLPGHTARLGDGWYELEGDYGNKYRWMGPRATAVLRRVHLTPQRLRIRGFAHEIQFTRGQPVVEIRTNGVRLAQQTLERVGLFIIEADLAEAETYNIEIAATPTWTVPGEDRTFTVNIGMIRLVDRES